MLFPHCLLLLHLHHPSRLLLGLYLLQERWGTVYSSRLLNSGQKIAFWEQFWRFFLCSSLNCRVHWKSANLLSPPPPPKKRLTGVDLVFSWITVTFLIFQKNPGLVYGLSIWISINIILLLLLSFPAFQLTEEGENITNSAFNMYQNSLKREDDPRISVIIDYR